MEKSLLKKTWKIAQQPLQNNERATQRWVGEAEMLCYQKPHPKNSEPQSGKISHSKTPWVRDWCFIAGTITLGTCARDTSPLKPLALKNNEDYVQEIQRAVGNGDSTLKALISDLTWGPAQKQQLEKSLDYLWRRSICKSKDLPEGQEPIKTLSRWRLWAPFW